MQYLGTKRPMKFITIIMPQMQNLELKHDQKLNIQLHVPNRGMFQVTVLSEPNSIVTEFLPEQTILSNIPQKNTTIIVQKYNTTIVHTHRAIW
jgi:hypothetical protein